MLTTIDRFGIRKSIFLPFLTALVLLVLGATFLVIRSVGGALEHPIRQRSLRLANLLAVDLEQAPVEAEAARALLERRLAGEENGSAFVLRLDGNALADRLTPGVKPEEVLAEYGRLGRPRCFSYADAIWCAGSSGDAGTDGSAAGDSVGGDAKARSRAWVGLSTAIMQGQVARVGRIAGFSFAAGGALLFVLVFLLTSRFVFGPMSEMRAVARRVSECDLTARVQKLAEDEMGSLSESLNRIGENLTVTLSHVKGVAEQVGSIIERIGKTGTTVAAGVGTVSARVLETGTSMGEMVSNLKGIAVNVETLAQSAEESSSSILEMAATNDEVSENIKSLAASVSETTAAIEQMTFSIKEVAKNIEALSATAEETSSSMNEMDLSISQVESNANETAKLSEQAQRDAEMGAEALSRTLAGIDKIKGSSKEAASVIEALGKKIATVGNILSVIDDVAEQTNLLALNAAILAAQSGEHGKGFAVVADEIKDLAERTGASTKEISDLIRSVQEESKNAIQAMDRGVKNVEEGVHLGQDAESALKKIQESSEKSTQMVKAIARATIEQARGSKHVTMAIHRIAETVQQIATATAEQARGSEQIMKSAEKMKIITKHVERSSEEQARGSKQITRSIEAISEMVNHLNRAQKDQDRASDQVMNAVVAIKRVAEAQTSSVQELEDAIADLVRQAEVLGGEVKKFKL